jgi:hypothetical protein
VEDILEPLGNDPRRAEVVARMARPYKLDQDWNPVEPATLSLPLDYVDHAISDGPIWLCSLVSSASA